MYFAPSIFEDFRMVWKVMGSNPGYLHKLFFLYTNNAFGSWQLCQKFCFAQFYHSRIQVFVNCSSLVRENLRLLRENVKHKILKIVQPHETPPSAMRWLHNGEALPTNDDRITLSSAWNPKVTFLVQTFSSARLASASASVSPSVRPSAFRPTTSISLHT